MMNAAASETVTSDRKTRGGGVIDTLAKSNGAATILFIKICEAVLNFEPDKFGIEIGHHIPL